MSTGKLANENYISVFEKDELNIYNANNTTVTVTRGEILKGWRDPVTQLWRIPLKTNVINNNTDTVLTKTNPTELLTDRPLPTEAVHNVYKLKTKPELIQYYHTAAGFPTKPTWIKAIKNKQYTS